MLNKSDTLQYLRALGLTGDEAKLYAELLKFPANHLSLSRKTGINRTKVYRLADQLEKRSLITTRTDDRGTLLVAADPRTLEIELVTEEEKLKQQRAIFAQLLPTLQTLNTIGGDPEDFAIHTYEGIEGFKQMLWHELRTKDEILVFCNGTVEDLIGSKRLAEKHRAMVVEHNYNVRELVNPNEKPSHFTVNDEFMQHYSRRYVDEEQLYLRHQIVIYNDTVGTYCWRGDQKVGVEIINKANAQMMRQVFEHYWQRAKAS